MCLVASFSVEIKFSTMNNLPFLSYDERIPIEHFTKDVFYFLIKKKKEGGTCRMIFDKTVLIKQLTVVEAHGILLVRTDRGLFESTLNLIV